MLKLLRDYIMSCSLFSHFACTLSSEFLFVFATIYLFPLLMKLYITNASITLLYLNDWVRKGASAGMVSNGDKCIRQERRSMRYRGQKIKGKGREGEFMTAKTKLTRSLTELNRKTRWKMVYMYGLVRMQGEGRKKS